MNKKVGLIAHYGEDYVGYRENFLRYLSEKGYSCFGIVPDDNYKEKVLQSPFKIYLYKYQRNWKFIFSVAKVAEQFKSYFKTERPDILFTYKFFPNIIGVLTGKKMKIDKVAATIAGIGFLENREKSLFIKLIFSAYMKILNKADYVITQNHDDQILLEKHLNHPKIILTHGSGVNPKNFSNLKIDDQTFYKLNYLSPDKKYIVFCSRIVKEKGILELINGFRNLGEDFGYDLIIAGWFDNKGLEEKVKNLIINHPKIHLLGYQRDVVSLLNIATVIILPSYYPEGVPRSLTESLALSKPIITTNHKGCKETCRDGYNGFLIEPRSQESLKTALLKFNQLTEDEILNFGVHSKRLFDEKFDEMIVFDTIAREMSL